MYQAIGFSGSKRTVFADDNERRVRRVFHKMKERNERAARKSGSLVYDRVQFKLTASCDFPS